MSHFSSLILRGLLSCNMWKSVTLSLPERQLIWLDKVKGLATRSRYVQYLINKAMSQEEH